MPKKAKDRPRMFQGPTPAKRKADSQKLSSLPNLGRVMELTLNQVGILTVDQFRKLGWQGTMKKLAVVHPRYQQAIYAQVLIGALRGRVWHQISESDKKASQVFCKKLRGH